MLDMVNGLNGLIAVFAGLATFFCCKFGNAKAEARDSAERFARLETKFEAVANDIAEIKSTIREMRRDKGRS